jgi:hypothetical protein
MQDALLHWGLASCCFCSWSSAHRLSVLFPAHQGFGNPFSAFRLSHISFLATVALPPWPHLYCFWTPLGLCHLRLDRPGITRLCSTPGTGPSAYYKSGLFNSWGFTTHFLPQVVCFTGALPPVIIHPGALHHMSLLPCLRHQAWMHLCIVLVSGRV